MFGYILSKPNPNIHLQHLWGLLSAPKAEHANSIPCTSLSITAVDLAVVSTSLYYFMDCCGVTCKVNRSGPQQQSKTVNRYLMGRRWLELTYNLATANFFARCTL